MGEKGEEAPRLVQRCGSSERYQPRSPDPSPSTPLGLTSAPLVRPALIAAPPANHRPAISPGNCRPASNGSFYVNVASLRLLRLPARPALLRLAPKHRLRRLSHSSLLHAHIALIQRPTRDLSDQGLALTPSSSATRSAIVSPPSVVPAHRLFLESLAHGPQCSIGPQVLAPTHHPYSQYLAGRAKLPKLFLTSSERVWSSSPNGSWCAAEPLFRHARI